MYNIKMVSKMLDMPAVTIRAWENRYQVVKPKRTESGHRVYSDQDIEDLRWLKKQIDQKGITISQAVQILKKRREEVVISDMPNLDGIIENLYQALLSFDSEKANSIIDLGFSMFHYEAIFYQVLAPIMHRIGDEWESGEVSVAQEHFASHLIFQRFTQFFRIFPVNQALPKVLALCPSGEHHQLGLLLFTLFLRKNGLEVIYLGSNTPPEGLDQVISSQDVNIIAISVTAYAYWEAVCELVGELSEKFPALKFVIGGPSVTEVPDTLEKWIISGDHREWQEWFQREVL